MDIQTLSPFLKRCLLPAVAVVLVASACKRPVVATDPGFEPEAIDPVFGYSLYNTWDLDDDGLLDEDEFATNLGEHEGLFQFDGFDTDGDGFIDDTEMSDGLFTQLDTDRDGFLDETEYRNGWFDESGFGFDTWDADGDGIVSTQDWATAYTRVDPLTMWDADGDGFLAEPEYSAGLYDSLDYDDSGFIEDDEFLF